MTLAHPTPKWMRDEWHKIISNDGEVCLVNMETGEVMTVPQAAITELGIRLPWRDSATLTDDEWLHAMEIVSAYDLAKGDNTNARQ